MPTNNAPVIHTATLDIVTANLNSSNVSVLLGNGAGGFTGNTTGLAGGTFPESVALGDVNGDGKLDIVTANFSDSASVLLGDGLGGFTASITRVADGTFPGSVALGDLNGDGKLDIVMANGRGNTISVLLGDGLGGFTASTTGIGNGGGPNSAALGDVNQDGRLDIVTPNFFSSNVSVLLGDGVGGFTASTTGIAGGNSPDSLALGDLNQDGRLDIVTANARSNNVSVLLANGAGGFTASTTGIAGGTDPRSVALGDVNADGKLDIITVNEVSNDVSVLLADGAGGFTASTTGIGGGTDPVSVALGDVNGDGKLDIVTANLESNNVSVLVGDGLGGFTASTIGIAGGVRPPSVALGDITDLRTVAEDTDLALTGISLSDVDASGPETLTLTVAHGTLAFGTTTGLTFAAGHDNGSGSLQATGTLADLNAALATLTYRGVQDYNGPDTLSLTLNDNDASGALQASAAVPIIVTPVNDAPVLDANASPALGAVSEDATLPQDGQQVGTLVSDLVRIGGNVSDPDVGAVTGIAVTATNSAHGTWFYSIDNGAHWALMGGVSGSSARVLAADSGTRIYFAPDADFNGTLTDGITFRAWDQSDLRPNGSGGVNTSPNGGASAFSSAVDTASITINAVADIAPDVLVTDEDTAQTINVLANDNFNDPGRQVTSVTQGGHGSVTFLPGGEVTYTPNADYNGSDLFSYVVTSGGVTETANVSVTVNAVNDAPVVHVPASLDIVTANSGNGNVSVLLGDGAGGFAASTVGIAGGINPFSVALGDLNGDGNLDIVTANFLSLYVSVLLGDGLGGFTASTASLADRNHPRSVALGDVNGDGKLDIVTANNEENVSVLLGDGAGAFTPSTIGIAGGRAPFSVALGDLNGDGKLDIVTANFNSNDVGVLLGDGLGGFTASTIALVRGSGPASVALGDVNQDGKLDIVTANAGTDNVSVLLGDGLGGFTARTAGLAGGDAPGSVALGDLNGDGKLDIVTANGNSDNVSVLLQDGLGEFTASTAGVAGGDAPSSVALDDVNGDGKLDIVTANARSNNVTVLLQDGAGGFTASTTGIAGGFLPLSVALGDVTDARRVAEDTDLALTGISLSDVDASTAETLTLAVAHGTLTLGTTAGLTFAAGSGNGAGTVQATGTLADLNAALATLSYRGVQDFNGTDTLTLTLNDNDATGALQASATVAIVVTAVDDAPTVTADAADHDLVEGVPFDPGQDTATVTLTKGDVDGTASYDAVALAGDNWTDNHDGTFSKQGAFGAATLHTTTDTVTYLLDNNLADSLNDGDAPTETFTVHVTDGSLPATADAIFTVDGRTDFVSSQNGLGINEFPADGTVVGAVAAQGGGGTFTYSLLDDFGGAFAIDDTGTIRVVDGLKLDFEQNPTIDLTVHRTDTTSGQTSDQVFTVTLNDVNVENITGDGDANTFFGGAFGDRLDGAGGNDVLRGNGGNNTLAGGAGFDTADYGGAPGGVYFDFGEGKAFFNGFGGTDMVSGFESFVGSAQGDVIGSGAGNHTIDGAGGNDAVSYANAPTAVSVDLAAGTAQNGFGGTDTLLHMETVLGSAFDDHLTGNGADNWLLGGAGADVMTGGLGNDTYAVDDQHDQVIENAGEGIDAVHSYIASYTLGDNVENLKLDGSASAGIGNGLANLIEGNDLDNFIDGKGGVDVMVGGDGNDTYIVDNPADVVIEQGDSDSPPVETFGEGSAGINAAPASSHGVDAVWAFTSYTLADNVEILVLGGHGDIDGTGNALDNVIVGNDGDNHIDGGAGGDLMMGGEGDDTYAVDNILDRVAEKAGQGIDTVNSTISAGLTDDVENLNLVGPGNLNALGNGGANTIVGNDGDNALDGAGGADTLTGGLGNDAFVFGRGQANGDTVTDFDGHGAAAGDVLIFSGYGAGATFTNIDATHWQVNYDGGTQHDVITFSNAASIHVNDVLFV